MPWKAPDERGCSLKVSSSTAKEFILLTGRSCIDMKSMYVTAEAVSKFSIHECGRRFKAKFAQNNGSCLFLTLHMLKNSHASDRYPFLKAVQTLHIVRESCNFE